MRKGTIEPDYSDFNNDVTVIDAELLVSIKKKYWFIPYFEFSDFNRKVIRYLRQRSDIHQQVIVGCVTNFKSIEHVINNVLKLPYSIINLHNEKNYEIWLKILRPNIHFAVIQRRYYYKKSVYLTEDILNQKEPAD